MELNNTLTNNLRIWLKNRDNPLEFTLSEDIIMDFTDFVNGNRANGLPKKSFVFDFGKGRSFMIFKTQVQAIEINSIDY